MTLSANSVATPYERIYLEGKTFDARYKLLNGAVIPRPIAFVTTLNEDGSVNAAPFSSFMIASVEEGLLAFSVGPSDRPKATLLNIQRSRNYVINTVPEELARQVQLCGEAQPSGVDRFQRPCARCLLRAGGELRRRWFDGSFGPGCGLS